MWRKARIGRGAGVQAHVRRALRLSSKSMELVTTFMVERRQGGEGQGNRMRCTKVPSFAASDQPTTPPSRSLAAAILGSSSHSLNSWLHSPVAMERGAPPSAMLSTAKQVRSPHLTKIGRWRDWRFCEKVDRISRAQRAPFSLQQ